MTKKRAKTEPTRPLAVVILAAGKGTRLKNRRPKVLQPICSRPMVGYILAACHALDPEEVRLVVGYGADQVKQAVGETVEYTRQRSQKGTGHAVMQCRKTYKRFAGDILVTTSDQPLIQADTLQRLVDEHRRTHAAATLLTNRPADPFGYGRIRRGKNKRILGVVEEKDCTAAQRRLREVNTCTYVFRAEDLFPALDAIDNDNAQGEFYLTDVIGVLAKQRRKLASVRTATADETDQVSDQADLARMTATMRDRINARHFANGVTLIDPASTFIGPEVEIAPDTIVYPNVHLEGATRIGRGAVLGPNTYIDDTEIGAGAMVTMSYVAHAIIKDEARIGPYAHVRPDTVVGREVRVGNFVELKNAVLHDGVKASHLTYIGDATIGADTNIGCGTITANYDGVNKNRTEIGANCHVGSGTVFIAPVVVGDDVITGAGAVVTRNQTVPDHTTLVGMPAVALPPRTAARAGRQRKRRKG